VVLGISTTDQFARISLLGGIEGCTSNGTVQTIDSGRLQIVLHLLCADSSVHFFDYYGILVIFPVLEALVLYLIWKKKHPSTWNFTHIYFIASSVTIVVISVTVGIINFVNSVRCDDDPFCPYEELFWDRFEFLCWILSGCFIVNCVVWVQVAAFAFPRPDDSEGSRFCSTYSPKKRTIVYLLTWSMFVVSGFFAAFVPIIIFLRGGGDFIFFHVTIMVPIFGVFALIPCFMVMCITCCDCCLCLMKPFEDEGEIIDDVTF